MKQSLATTEDIKEMLADYPTKTQIEDVFKNIRDEIFERLDNISGQLETIREEQTIGYHQFKELEEKVEDHEKSITFLKSSH